MCVCVCVECVCADSLRRRCFSCGCSALCSGIDRVRDVVGGRVVMEGGFLGGCQRSRWEI